MSLLDDPDDDPEERRRQQEAREAAQSATGKMLRRKRGRSNVTPMRSNSTQATGNAQAVPRKTAATCASRYVNPTSANGRRMSIPPQRGFFCPQGTYSFAVLIS